MVDGAENVDCKDPATCDEPRSISGRREWWGVEITRPMQFHSLRGVWREIRVRMACICRCHTKSIPLNKGSLIADTDNRRGLGWEAIPLPRNGRESIRPKTSQVFCSSAHAPIFHHCYDCGESPLNMPRSVHDSNSSRAPG